MTHIAILAAAAAALAVAVLFGVTLMLRDRRSSVAARLQPWGAPRTGGGLYDREKDKHKAHSAARSRSG